jgi:hypothetical protein
MRIRNSLILIIIFIGTPLCAEEESIWDKAKRNAAPDSISIDGGDSSKRTNDAVFPMRVNTVETVEFVPVLLKIIVPWKSDKPVATIYYKGGEAPYREGDFVPPFYRVKGITSNMVALTCTAEKDDRERCISELSFSGVY